MGYQRRRGRQGAAVIGLFVCTQVWGCTGPVEPGGETGISAIAALGFGGRTRLSEDEGNDSFDSPTAFLLAEGQLQSIDGAIQSTTDIDVYEIGPLYWGDRLVVDLRSEGRLDAAVGVFDADENLLYLNDDRNYFASLVDPYINFVVRRETERAYVVVSSSPNGSTTGSYTLSVTVNAEAADPEPQPQTVLLNFDGASGVAFGRRAAVDISPFDAGAVSPELAGRTGELIDLILAKVRADYAGLNVAFISSRDAVEPAGEVSTIHFGAHDPGLLGVAESVDEFNERTVQEAIVFADTFEVFNALSPTLEEYAQAFANVASHETGHLLGLVHTADVRSIMDITATLRQLMANQAFSRSPIEVSTFSVGLQDAALTLVESVGGDLATVVSNSAAQLVRAKRTLEAHRSDLPDGPRAVFSTCAFHRGAAGRR